MRYFRLALLLCLALLSVPSMAAPVSLPLVQPSWATSKQGSEGAVLIDSSSVEKGTSANPLTVNIGSGGGGTVTLVPTGINVSVTPVIQNAAYASGNCMGPLQTLSMGTASSVLNGISLSSRGGLTTNKQIYLFYANPTASTCTDKAAFVLAAADVSKLIPGGVFSLAPAATTGTTTTTGAATTLGLGIPSGGVVYAAIVETTTETPASTSDLILGATGF